MLSLRTSALPLLLLLTPAFASKGNEDDRPISSCVWTCLSTYALNVDTFTCQSLTANTGLVSCIKDCPVRDITNYVDQVLNLDASCEAQLFPVQGDNTTGTVTNGPTVTTEDNGGNRPTGSSDDSSSDDKGGDRTKTEDDNGNHGGDDSCHDMSDDDGKSSSWSGACTRTRVVETGTATGREDNTVTKTDDSTTSATRVPTASDGAPVTPSPTPTGLVTVTTSTATGNSTGTVGPSSTSPANETGAAVVAFDAPFANLVLVGLVAGALVM